MVERVGNILQENNPTPFVLENNLTETVPDISRMFPVTSGFINCLPRDSQNLMYAYCQDPSLPTHIEEVLSLTHREDSAADRKNIRQHWVGKICETISRSYLSQILGPNMAVMQPDQVQDLINLRFLDNKQETGDLDEESKKLPRIMFNKPQPDTIVLKKVGFVTQFAASCEATITPSGARKNRQLNHYEKLEPIDTILGNDIDEWNEREKWRGSLKNYIKEQFPQFPTWEVGVSHNKFRIYYTYPEDRSPVNFNRSSSIRIPIPIKIEDLLKTTEALMQDVGINDEFGYEFSPDRALIRRRQNKKKERLRLLKTIQIPPLSPETRSQFFSTDFRDTSHEPSEVAAD